MNENVYYFVVNSKIGELPPLLKLNTKQQNNLQSENEYRVMDSNHYKPCLTR
jgi:hypothetical protein